MPAHTRIEAPPFPATIEAVGDGAVRVVHAKAELEIAASSEAVFAAFSSWRGYDRWEAHLHGPAHWLTIRRGGLGSRFVLYDKPAGWHLIHEGIVTRYEPPKRFEWRAAFQEWPRALAGTDLELAPTATGGTLVREQLVFEIPERLLPVLAGFLASEGLDHDTLCRFLTRRLAGLAAILETGQWQDHEPEIDFTTDQQIAVDWAGRISEGEWTRILYADGEFDLDAPTEPVFNAFARFSRYPEWTRDIHVGCEWLDIRAQGVGSTFLLWEKPGGRQVMHRAVVTEFEHGQRFAWRAPFAEWGKVFIGTSLTLEPGPGGSTHAYHLLYADVPTDLLTVFGGFGALHGFDLEFETFHIHEEARGFERLLRDRAFTDDDVADQFIENRTLAGIWPLQEGRPWPAETLTLEPDRTITFEQLAIELADELAGSVPSPTFLRDHRDLARTLAHHRGG